MPFQVLSDAKVTMGPYDISGDLSRVKLVYSADSLENSAMGSLAHTYIPGAINIKLHHEGFVQFGATQTTIDGRMDSVLGVVDVPVSVAARGGDIGEEVFFFKALHTKYDRLGDWGQLMKFQVDADASGSDVQLAKGIIFEDGKTARTIAGNTATQVFAGGVSAVQKVFAQIHLKAFTGTNVTFTLKSAVTDWGTPTTRATFTTNTAVGSQWIAPISGPITDTFWRFEWTVTALTSMNVILLAGRQ